MPLSRYQIRNEYSLADPELYRAADKDDPEALLEGVAMAGLVGVLRQLGDLAEFAAEIFHDLHEEVMVTAARGHGLMVRVQQLEAEFPSIEKAFLSQSSHSSFFYNSGLVWHPNIRMDQSLIARGDLPRFVMDSYEECRGPPRLFLLDKFDVAGAGACLKRYSDPSFFKVEPPSFGITGTDVQREKKARKAKKRGSRWRNGETPEGLPPSHAKLHQLFLEERIENGISETARRVKLKRRLNGFPFASKSGKSYMEKFLKSPSPDHKEVHEIAVDPSTYESALELAKISTASPEKELDPRSISLSSSPAKEEIIPEFFVDKLNEVPSGTRDSVVLQSDPNLEAYNDSGSGVEAYDIASTLQLEDSEKEIAVDDGSKTDDSIDDYQSDDIVSEIDNYMDALTTMESEMDADSEFKIKNDLRYLNSRREARGLDANNVQLQDHSLDSQSVGNSSLSDDGNSSSKKMSSFSYSDTHSTAAENTPSDAEVSSNIFPSTEIHGTEVIDSSLDPLPVNEEHPQSHSPGNAALGGLFTETAKIASHSSELGDQTACLGPSDSDPSYRSVEAFTKEIGLMFTESDKILTNPSLNGPHISSISEATEHKDYDSTQRLSGENQLMDEPERGTKDTSEIVPDTFYLSASSRSKDDIQHHVFDENHPVDELNDKDENPDENVAFVTHQNLNDDGPSQTNHENLSLLSTDDRPLDVLHGEDQTLSENSPLASNLSDSPSELRDGLQVAVSAESLPVEEIVDEYPNSIVDSFSNMAAEKNGDGSSVDRVPERGTDEDLHIPNPGDNQSDEENPVVLLTGGHPFGQTHYLDAEPGVPLSEMDGQSAGEIADNVTPKEDTPSELIESLVSETHTEVLSIRSPEEQISCSRELYFDEPSKTGDGAEMGEVACNTTPTESDSTAEPLLLAGNHVDLDEIDTDSVNGAAAVASLGNNAIDDGDGSSGDIKTVQEVGLSGSEGEVEQLIAGEACLFERPGELGATEGLCQQIFSLHGSNSGFAPMLDNDQSVSESQVVDDVSGTRLLLEAKDNVDATAAAAIQLSFKQNELESSETEEKVESLTNHLDQPLVLEAKSKVLNDLDQTQYEKQIDHVGPFVASSNSLPVNFPNDPSDTELSLQGSSNINIPEHPVYPPSSTLSSFSAVSNASQIYVDEMPPMPPLPPVQWRMTKFQHASPGQESVFMQNSASTFSPLFPSKAYQDTEPVNQPLPQPALEDENSHPFSEQPIGKAVHLGPFISQVPSLVHRGDSKDYLLPLEGMQYTSILQSSGLDGEIMQNSFQDEKIENEKSRLNSSSNSCPIDTASYSLELSHEEFAEPLNKGASETSLNEEEVGLSSTVSVENVVASVTTLPSETECERPKPAMPASAHAFGFSSEKLIRPFNQVAPETSTEEKELGNRSVHQEENLGSFDNNSVSSKTENEQPQHAVSTSEATLAWPVGEENKLNGLRPMKLPRPRNPLIDAVAAHDKSKLRKVTERVRPQTQKVDERDSLLEQIRTKSFNLKPAVVTRPSIPGPTTNLKVAAILEKAKTIRQAFAGSDEDDDDCWSDS